MPKEDVRDVLFVAFQPYDGAARGMELFAQVRRNFRTSGRRASGTVRSEETGERTVTRYRISRRKFYWKRTVGKRLVQRAYARPGGYDLITWDPAGRIVSKARYGKGHVWQRTAYYAGDLSRPEALLMPAEEGRLTLLKYDEEWNSYEQTLLVPCAYREGTAEQSLINAAAGEPEIFGETVGGGVCYCTPEEKERRDAVRRDLQTGAADAQPDWEPERDADVHFSYIKNNSPAPPKPEHKRFLNAVPSPAVRPDYAADHELFSIGEPPLVPKPLFRPEPAQRPEQEKAPEPKQPPKPEQQLELEEQPEPKQPPEPEEAPEPEQQLELEEQPEPKQPPRPEQQLEPEQSPKLEKPFEPVQPPEPEEAPPQPARYAVASKGVSGSARAADPFPFYGDRPTKRIVVSAEESYLYFGKVLDGLREGRGRTQMQNGGTAYEGGYSRDKRDGFGVYYYKSGKLCYAGNWKENMRNGAGVAFSSRDGSIFVGKWKDNVPTGVGAAFDAEGNLLYTGEWKNGLRHGRGTEYRDGKVVFSGEFRNDRYDSGFRRVETKKE